MSRITVVKFGPIVVPHVNTIRRTRGGLSDTGRTAGGIGRSDTVRVWREWEIRATPPASIADALERHLDLIMWQYDDWWCLDMGQEVSARAKIDEGSWSNEIVLGNPDWRILAFNVIEQ